VPARSGETRAARVLAPGNTFEAAAAQAGKGK
jgi:hypothetical protein